MVHKPSISQVYAPSPSAVPQPATPSNTSSTSRASSARLMDDLLGAGDGEHVEAGIAILEEAGGLITMANPPADPTTAPRQYPRQS
ncbi:hypothetical protein C2857_000581 [Epichloe festucae Fl1]|uniref:Uncharacterized protein n=1 Tax=Epichloe festucae (strain Fl1) TaxID=877507 RepID=A0A7U3Q171_EPIFF|nr:hypothetical protein C2857_000581 [Epichloe festucae Fl1]